MKAKLDHKKCTLLLKEEQTPRNIFLHSRKVNAISMFIAKRLKEKGENVNLAIVDMGSLLHDIAKYKAIKSNNGMKHNYEGYNMLMTKGYPFIARVVLKHGLDEIIAKYGLKGWEETIVFYADKRVNRDKIVSLDDRLTYLKRRYGKISHKIIEKIIKTEKPLKELERQIFKKLGLKPEDINEKSVKKFLIKEDY